MQSFNANAKSFDNVNKIHCCRYCGKNYMKKTNLEKHIVMCEFLRQKCVTKPTDVEEIPSLEKIYKLLLELGNKYNKLEEKLDELDKLVVKKKIKINVVDWLNHHKQPTIPFKVLIEKIVIEKDDIQHLFKYSFADTLDTIFSRSIYEEDKMYPMVTFKNVFYIYESDVKGWNECDKSVLCGFLNKVHLKIHRMFILWKKENAAWLTEDEQMSVLTDRTAIKLMNVDFGQDSTLSKIKTNMCARMSISMD